MTNLLLTLLDIAQLIIAVLIVMFLVLVTVNPMDTTKGLALVVLMFTFLIINSQREKLRDASAFTQRYIPQHNTKIFYHDLINYYK